MTPERFEEIKRISAGIGNPGLLAGIIEELVTEIDRLRADPRDTTGGRVERLQLENEQLKFCYLEDVKISSELVEEVKRLRAEVERLQLENEQLKFCYLEDVKISSELGRLTTPKHGFLAWAMQVEDALPPGMARGVNVEELRRWHEAGMTAEGAAERVKETG